MGEKVEKKNEADKEAVADGGGEKEEGPATVVLKMDFHCEGCAKKVRRSLSHLQGVDKVKTDRGSSKLIVTGNVDPTLLRDRVENRTMKKVDLLFPLPKMEDAAAGDKKPAENKTEDKKPKEALVSTVVMKVKLHCEGCAHKIRRLILKNVDGVNSVTMNLENNLVTVLGTIVDPIALSSYLQHKLRRPIDIIPPPKKEKEAAEKGQESGGGGGGGGGEAKNVEASKMDYFQGYNPQKLYVMGVNPMYGQGYMIPTYHNHGYGAQPPPPPTTYVHDEMFSDDNPSGCSIM